jgi:hypothetical protein
MQLGIQVLQPPGKFGNITNYRDILRSCLIGIGAYSKVNIKYFNLLPYDSITKIALLK